MKCSRIFQSEEIYLPVQITSSNDKKLEPNLCGALLDVVYFVVWEDLTLHVQNENVFIVAAPCKL